MSIPIIAAIVGPSGSGKSYLTQALKQALEKEKQSVLTLQEDNYYKDQAHIPLEERVQTNYDAPSAFDHALLEQQLSALKANQSIECPQYCYETHTRLPQTVPVAPQAIILVEGIMLFTNPSLRAFFDIKCFIDTPLDICLLRRIKRDVIERGRTLKSILTQYEQTVRPMYYEHVEPGRALADFLLSGDEDETHSTLERLKTHILTETNPL